MLTINQNMPSFKKLSNITLNTEIENAFPEVEFINEEGQETRLIIKDTEKTLADKKGEWLIIFGYPKDFTFVCPTEIRAFGDLNEDFEDRDANVLAFSTDNEFVHRAWRRDNDDIREVPFPLIADTNGSLSKALGVYNEEEGIAERATFIVDPNGVIQHVSINAGSVGRNPDEILRILDALQADELCPCNWKAGDETLKPE
jgi:peroxiredoxin (alkyl hydroperoxide reductase subunit C)